MSFNAGADAYDRFMGRYSKLLAPQFADFAGVTAGQRLIDVGCGPGALTTELARRVDPADISAIDPTESFVDAIRVGLPDVTVRQASAEEIPFEDAMFDAALAQLVVHFMANPVKGIGEMARVTREGGVVAACVWDNRAGHGPLGAFWQAAHMLDPDVDAEPGSPGSREGELAAFFGEAGLGEIEDSSLAVSVEHATFEEWWEPYTLGVGRIGDYFNRLGTVGQAQLREACRELLPPAPFVLTADCWAVRAIV
jgi:SAM-dependent methyltransferase